MIAVEGQVNLDDLLDGSAGGVIRARQPGMVQQITGASVGGEIEPLMDYLDSVKETRTGMSRASQGLSPMLCSPRPPARLRRPFAALRSSWRATQGLWPRPA